MRRGSSTANDSLYIQLESNVVGKVYRGVYLCVGFCLSCEASPHVSYIYRLNPSTDVRSNEVIVMTERVACSIGRLVWNQFH